MTDSPTLLDLQILLDERAIIGLTHTYCWTIDRHEFENLRSVFTADGFARLGRDCNGVDDIISRITQALTPLDDSQHIVANHQVTVDGDRATCRCYFHAQHVRRDADGGPNYVIAGRYEDRCVRTDQGWRIEHRVLTVMWTDGNVRVVNPSAG